MVHGVIVDTTNPNSMRMAREAGFTHAKMILYWPRLEPSPGQLPLERHQGERPRQRHEGGPRRGDAADPADRRGARLGRRLAGQRRSRRRRARSTRRWPRYAKGTVVGYEILNEPNLPFEWGGPPDPAGYTAFLKAAYRGVKAGDPGAIVIGGGPSPNTGGFGGTIEDTDFLNGMYDAGAKGFMDALGVHNYGGNTEPERDPGDCGICFRRAELYRSLMVKRGDAGTPIWATEFGWLMDPGFGLGQYDWMKVSPEQQAEYVVRSYQYAQKNWPWMRGMLLSNLDASTSPYHQGPEDGLPWFAILNADYSPRPAWSAFRDMRAQINERQSAGRPARGGAADHPGARRPRSPWKRACRSCEWRARTAPASACARSRARPRGA